jgi:glycosyltransferase involved in cell wall biosynthesis
MVSNALKPPYDEGIKKFSIYLSRELSEKGVLIVRVSPDGLWLRNKLFLSGEFANYFKRNQVKVIIYIPTQSASFGSFLRSAVLRRMGIAKVLLVAMQPVRIPKLSYSFISTLAPDLILTPSIDLYEYLTKLNINSELLPMGIDLERFKPITLFEKKLLRAKFGIPETKFVILHVGHLQPLRNLDWILNLKKNIECFPIIVSSVSMGMDQTIAERIRSSQIYFISDYIQNIEEMYQLSDCYIFPVLDNRGAIGIPLSVLEAMACNIPVITTPFGGLPHFFMEGKGLFYVYNEDQIINSIKSLLDSRSIDIRTREKVVPYSWDHISQIIIEKAHQLLWN